MPEYLMYPTFYPMDRSSPQSIKLVDFGESFLCPERPETLHTPLVVRPPEVIFKDQIDFGVDLWSMGCMLFELVAGQPPFDSLMMDPTFLVRQMCDATGEELPERWQPTWRAMKAAYQRDLDESPKLQDWLEDIYFDSEFNSNSAKNDSLTREDIAKVGELIRKLLRLEPSERALASEIVADPWFQE